MRSSSRLCSVLVAVLVLVAKLSFASLISGSGFIIQPDGFILTNYHVIKGSTAIVVVVPGMKPVRAKVVAADGYKDLALLQVPLTNLPALPIASSHSVQVLDPVTVLGYPLAQALGVDVSASDGKVNAIREEGSEPYFQVDANVNPGNSGGPLLNNRGEVVGIVVAKIDALGMAQNTGSIPERINFAIPIDEARGMIRQAFPFAFSPSNRQQVLSAQEVFRQAKPSTVLIVAEQSEVTEDNNGDKNKELAAASRFIYTFVKSGETGAEYNQAAFYGNKVDYFDNGVVDHHFIANELDEYNYRWPERHFELVEAPKVVYDSKLGCYLASFRVACALGNASKRIEGTCDFRAALVKADQGFRIIYIRERFEPSNSVADNS
jgi:hypothetical protein